eukprot:gene9553-biopygen3725
MRRASRASCTCTQQGKKRAREEEARREGGKGKGFRICDSFDNPSSSRIDTDKPRQKPMGIAGDRRRLPTIAGRRRDCRVGK